MPINLPDLLRQRTVVRAELEQARGDLNIEFSGDEQQDPQQATARKA